MTLPSSLNSPDFSLLGISESEFFLGMDERLNNDESSLMGRIQQLERERDELRKDIEQLCLQQAGPSYLAVATRMHFQRTAGLEQEIENLRKKVATCTREKMNLQEELSEVYRIKSQLADLHSAEVSKNMEAEKQVKFFQSCVAAAFAERDHSLMEAEKAKEREEAMVMKLNDLEQGMEELTSDCLEAKKVHATLQVDLMKLKEQNETLSEVINKFYDIRQNSLGDIVDRHLDEKCECLLHDDPEMWSFEDHRETSTSEYIGALEKELETLKNSVDNLQNKLRMGLEIEDHLRKKVCELEKKKFLSDDLIKNRISELHHFHIHHRCEVMNLLEQEKTWFKSMLDEVQERIGQLSGNRIQNFEPLQRDAKIDDIECRDVHITTDADHSVVPEKNVSASSQFLADGTAGASDFLAQALQEKVGALLLLSQQEERHLLEGNVIAALQQKMDDLQRNLLQVTNEKVKALMELAQLRQEYQLLQEKLGDGMKQGNFPADVGDKSIVAHERDGKLKNLLKKTYLKRWVGRLDLSGNEADCQMNNNGGNLTNKSSNYSVEFARMKIENATLKESIESMERLTSSVHRLRVSLLKAKDAATTPGTVASTIKALDSIISDAKLIKTALGSSLPVSWLVEVDHPGSSCGSVSDEPTDDCGSSDGKKLDTVSAAGFEMVEPLILAAELLKENITKSSSRDES